MKTFSVIVPTYNRPERLKACLAAIDQLAWPADDYEVIVVDDGSPQPVGEDVGSRGNVRVMRQPNAGPAAARNTGARAATGQLLAFTDDDCTPQADWLRVLARAFEEPQVSLAGGRLVNALPDDRYAAASQSITDYAYGLPSDGPRLFATANLACRATVFEAVSGFDESFPLAAGEDYDFCHRLQHAGHRAVYAPEAVVHHRHAMTLRGYVRQHFAYGRGLLAFRRRAAERSGETSARPQPLSFYSGLVMHPLKHGGGVVGAALVALSQAATAAGGGVGSTLFTRGQTMRVLIVNDLGRALRRGGEHVAFAA